MRVLIDASFREKKGIPYALAALGRLQRELDIHVSLISDSDGTRRSSRERARILETIDRFDLDKRAIPFLLEGGTHALLADERDVDGLVERFRRLGEPGLWEHMTVAARRRMENDFDSRRLGEDLNRVCRDLL